MIFLNEFLCFWDPILVGETDFANLKEEARLVEILGAADVGGSGVSPNAEPNAS